MQDFQEKLTIKMSGKNHYALVAFLKKHGFSKDDVSRFVEDAIVWRIMDREIAFRKAMTGDEAVAPAKKAKTVKAKTAKAPKTVKAAKIAKPKAKAAPKQKKPVNEEAFFRTSAFPERPVFQERPEEYFSA